MFLRFVRPNKIKFMAARAGFLNAAYEMRSVRTNDRHSSAILEDHLAWFRENLAIPTKFTRSNSKGAWRSDVAKGPSWFKADALEMLAHAHDLTAMLMENGYPIAILRTERIGYVIYEDAHQAVAEPFADTPI